MELTAKGLTMSASIIKFRPEIDPDTVIDLRRASPGDVEQAHVLGGLMALRYSGQIKARPPPGSTPCQDIEVIIRPLAYGSEGTTLGIYFDRGMDARQIALRTGLSRSLVKAFGQGYRAAR